MNEVLLIGRTTKEIELKEYGKGRNAGTVCSFTIAVKDGKDKDGEDVTQFIRCTAWNGSAEVLKNYVKKGDRVGVVGRLVNNNYEDKDGHMVYQTEVSVSRIELIELKEKKDKGRK